MPAYELALAANWVRLPMSSDKFKPKGSFEKAERSEAIGCFYVLGIGCLLAGIVQLSIYFLTGLLLVPFSLIHNNTWLLSVWKCFKYILLKISV